MQYHQEMPPPTSAMVAADDGRSIQSHRTSGSNSMLSTSMRSMRSLSEAQEAEILSRATSQAMIAARSILLSGGSEKTALSTAKAAANSILVPNTNELKDPILGKKFIGRRKAKRQAEVVASMALLSVKQQALMQPPISLQHSGNLEASSFMQGVPRVMTPVSHAMSDQIVYNGENGYPYRRVPSTSNYSHSTPVYDSRPSSVTNNNNNNNNHNSSTMMANPHPTRRHNRLPPRGPPPADPNRSSNQHRKIIEQLQVAAEEHAAADGSRSGSGSGSGSGSSRNAPSPTAGKYTLANLRKKIPLPHNLGNNNQSDRRNDLPPPEKPKRPVRVPSELPKSKPKGHHHSPNHNQMKTENLAKSLPEEDPIYYNISPRTSKSFASGDSMSGSESQSDYSGTYGSDTLEDATTTIAPVVPARASNKQSGAVRQPDFINSSVDPLLTTLTNVFFCVGPGYGSTCSPNEAGGGDQRKTKKSSVESRNDERGDEDGLRSSSYTDEGDDGDGSTNRRQDLDAADSRSTTESVFKDLNVVSSTDDVSDHKPVAKSSIRESMEQVVLRALESALSDDTPRDSNRKDKIKEEPTIMASDIGKNRGKEVGLNDNLSSTSSLSTSGTGRLQALSQRVKFRRWMRRRRNQEVDPSQALVE